AVFIGSGAGLPNFMGIPGESLNGVYSANLGIGGALFETIAVFTICSAVGGFLSKYGKTAVCVGISVAAAVSAIYCAENAAMVFGYLDIPLAALFVLLTSDFAVRSIGRISGVRTEKTSEEQCKEFVRNRLNSASDSFRILAETFLDLSDKHNRVDMEDVSMMFDSAAERVCKKCSRVGECWVTGFNSTYKSLFRMLEIMERKGELTEDDVDGFFADRCLRLRALVREMNRLFEIYKINCVWKSKLNENRELAGQQLGSVAQILDSIARDIYEEEPDGSVEEELRMRISDRGIELSEVNVAVNANGRYRAYISGFGNAETIRRSAETAFKTVLGVKMVMVGRSERPGGEAVLRFAQPEGYRIESGVARIGKTEESGDNCATRYLSDGKFAAALSDGMGTGHRASRDSGATVKLLGDFLEAGFDKTIAVRLVNSIMVMKSANEAFATVDMCVIDLYSGEIEFVKNGAEPSYIKRREGTETVRSASLPIGVMQDMEIESFARKVDVGDIIVMLSDGLQMKKGHEEWIKNMVDEAAPDMPSQELADRLIEIATAIKGDEADDDMTVVVLKVYSAG
ncbi:MAG: SpoIIE family protein phosphatase, partial [Clostridia bacterium]|nr:SpoIIE family protein phosphatase [Clostridia bacterium]